MAVKKTADAECSIPEKAAGLFLAEQLLSAERFRDRRDILSALLKPGEKYTILAAEQLIENYMKGQVR